MCPCPCMRKQRKNYARRCKLKVTSHAKIERNTSVGACSHKRLFRSIFIPCVQRTHSTAVNEINVECPLRHIYELSAWLVTQGCRKPDERPPVPLLPPQRGHRRQDQASLYPSSSLNYYPCQGQSALSMPNFNEASLSDTLQLVYSYKILWETGSLIPFYIGHYYNNQSSHQWLLLLRKKLPISLI